MRTRFEYRRASSAADAIALLAKHGEGAMIWAGGTDMTLHWQHEKLRPEICIDIRNLAELDYVRIETDKIRIGAMVSLAALERSGDRHDVLAMLADISKQMCTPQTRTLATIGGNVCNASPAADLSPACVALNASAVILNDRGQRTVPMVEFFQGVNKTALRAGEILQEVTIPLPESGSVQGAYRRIDRTVVDIALVNAAAALTVEDGTIVKAGLALGAVAPVVLAAPDAAAKLEGTALGDISRGLLADVAAAAAAHARPITDIRASAQYRQDMVQVMLRRALEDTIIKHGGML